MLAVTLPTGKRRGCPEMGRRAAHRESALQAAVLLAVLALSIAAPRTAVRGRLEEAGSTGRTTVDYTVWTDVPKEALTIFDMVAPSRHNHTVYCMARPPDENEKDVGTAGASRLGRDQHGAGQEPHGNGRQQAPRQGEPHEPRPQLDDDERGTPPRTGHDGPAPLGRATRGTHGSQHCAEPGARSQSTRHVFTTTAVITLASLAMMLALAAGAVTAHWAGYGHAHAETSTCVRPGGHWAGADRRRRPRGRNLGLCSSRVHTMRRWGGAAPGAAKAPGWSMPRPMRRTQHVTRRHRQTGGRSRAYARGASGEDGAAGCTTCTSTGVHKNVRPKNEKNNKKPRPVRRRHHHGRLPGLGRAGMLLGIATLG